MGDLDARHSAVLLDNLYYPAQRLDVFVAPDADVKGGDAPERLHGGGLGDNQSRAAHSARTQVYHLPVI